MALRLVPIGPDGSLDGAPGPLPAPARDVVHATVALYRSAGHRPPWSGYLARDGDAIVGACGFKRPPCDARVEIAYFTFPGHEGRGVATAMAGALVDLARAASPATAVAARTLPGRGASHRVLEKLGFRHVATVEDPDDGAVWEWRLDGPGTAR